MGFNHWSGRYDSTCYMAEKKGHRKQAEFLALALEARQGEGGFPVGIRLQPKLEALGLIKVLTPSFCILSLSCLSRHPSPTFCNLLSGEVWSWARALR